MSKPLSAPFYTSFVHDKTTFVIPHWQDVLCAKAFNREAYVFVVNLSRDVNEKEEMFLGDYCPVMWESV